jgi:hypothetical protein
VTELLASLVPTELANIPYGRRSGEGDYRNRNREPKHARERLRETEAIAVARGTWVGLSLPFNNKLARKWQTARIM